MIESVKESDDHRLSQMDHRAQKGAFHERLENTLQNVSGCDGGRPACPASEKAVAERGQRQLSCSRRYSGAAGRQEGADRHDRSLAQDRGRPARQARVRRRRRQRHVLQRRRCVRRLRHDHRRCFPRVPVLRRQHREPQGRQDRRRVPLRRRSDPVRFSPSAAAPCSTAPKWRRHVPQGPENRSKKWRAR